VSITKYVTWVCLVPLSLFSFGAKASVIYDSLVPGCCGWNIGDSPGSTLEAATGFEPQETIELTSISFDLIGSSGGTGDFVINIFADNGDTFHAPGEEIASFGVPFPAALAVSAANNLIFTATAPAGIYLQAGEIYWISPWSSNDADWALWWDSQQTGLRAVEGIGTNSWSSACGATNDCGVMTLEVDGNVVPEPSMLALCSSFLALAILIARRSKSKSAGR
jgi:hypothetical protein